MTTRQFTPTFVPFDYIPDTAWLPAPAGPLYKTFAGQIPYEFFPQDLARLVSYVCGETVSPHSVDLREGIAWVYTSSPMAAMRLRSYDGCVAVDFTLGGLWIAEDSHGMLCWLDNHAIPWGYGSGIQGKGTRKSALRPIVFQAPRERKSKGYRPTARYISESSSSSLGQLTPPHSPSLCDEEGRGGRKLRGEDNFVAV